MPSGPLAGSEPPADSGREAAAVRLSRGEELQRLVDELDVVRYRDCAATDGRNRGDLARCFTPHPATVFPGLPERHGGLGEIQRAMSSSLEPLDGSQHLVTNHLIELSGCCDLTVLRACAARTPGLEGGENFTLAGTYEVHLPRRGGGSARGPFRSPGPRGIARCRGSVARNVGRDEARAPKVRLVDA